MEKRMMRTKDSHASDHCKNGYGNDADNAPEADDEYRIPYPTPSQYLLPGLIHRTDQPRRNDQGHQVPRSLVTKQTPAEHINEKCKEEKGEGPFVAGVLDSHHPFISIYAHVFSSR
jgi:hypothetical protein